ncbi:MAG TPA: GAF and ANTAR domain-containing protein, partial [Acidimicrobiia bacterium]|nr:GAF and ANTAR domain-containing protein [Acidimicrobiia bacterium]
SLGDQDGLLHFVSASSETITEIERVQELAQRGTCVDAYKSGVVAQSSDLTAETRWPELAPDTVRLGLRSIVAIPMRLTDQTIGSLNIYDARPREWLPDDIQAAQVRADMAVSYISNASALERAERVPEQLENALESRVGIEQAKGMVAADQGIGVDEAFKRLRVYARARHVGIHEVSAAVVNLGLRIN